MKFYKKKLSLSIFLALGLAACSPNKTPEEYLSSAKTSISQSKNADAVIALKNALRVDLKNAEARFLLGTLYLKAGEAAAAEKELTRALTLSDDVSDVLPKLLKALHLQNKSNEIISLTNKYDEITPEVLLYQSLAYMSLGEDEKAKQSIIQANELSTESVYSQLGEAYLNADSANFNDTIENINQILTVTPNLTEALMLQGQLFFAKEDYTSAINSFNKFHQLLPGNTQVRLFLANSYIKNQQFDEGGKQLDFLLKLYPEHAFSNQLKGLVYYNKADYKNALSHTEKAIQNGLNISANKVIAGLSAFKLGKYELAHQYLVTLSEILPPTHYVHRVLALVQIQLGYNSDASDTLTELEGLSSQDINLFTTASFELLKAGKIGEAKELLSKMEELDIDNAEDMTKVGILKLSLDDLDGLTDLEKAVEKNPELTMAKLALSAVYIKNKEYDKALSMANQWKKSKPNEVEGYNLAARVYLLQEDIPAAEIEFNQALTINENNSQSIIYFSRKSLENNKPKKAIEQLDKLFVTSPNHLKGLEITYHAHKALNMANIAVDKIAKSYSENERNTSYRLLYSRVLFMENDFDGVVELLKETQHKVSIPALQWILLGDSYSKLNKRRKALEVYNDWLSVSPQYRVAWLKKISIQDRLTDYNGALASVEQVLLRSPKDDQFTVLLANYLILTKQFEKAQAQLDALTKEQKDLVLVKGLQGQIWLSEGKFKQALHSLEGLYKLHPSPFNTALLFTTYRKVEQDKVAFDFIQKHVELFPKDNASRNLLAESAIVVDQALAKKHYLILLELIPNNLFILNNLAWVEYLLEDYKSAEQYINTAMVIDDANPQILDTAGLIQLKLGNKAVALELLNKARLLAPYDKGIAQHYNDANK